MLHEEVKKYRELSRDTNPNTPISRIGGYLDGYEKALEQEQSGDLISRDAVEDKLLKLCNELEGIFSNIRMQNQDESVCGLCEYDCPEPYECPGFDIEDCFKLADEIRHKWQSIKDLPSVKQETKYCDRNICISNEYNGIGCNECEITKSQEPPSSSENPNKWIPVSERLPEPYERENGCPKYYLIQNEYGDMLVARYCGLNGWEQMYQDDYVKDEVIAWMPLPKPYKPQESEGL